MKSLLFTDQMSRALRAGRKTQTRRLIKLREFQRSDTPGYAWTWRNRRGCWEDVYDVDLAEHCPYGKPGDVLFVREGVIQIGFERTGRNGQYKWPKFDDEAKARRWFDKNCLYAADLSQDDPMWDEPHGRLNKLFMPQWAARTFVELTEIRVQRLNEITEEDAQAEGPTPMNAGDFGMETWRSAFRNLWISIHGHGSWEQNPWLWALSFRVTSNQPEGP